jgi:hypothetical protein
MGSNDLRTGLEKATDVVRDWICRSLKAAACGLAIDKSGALSPAMSATRCGASRREI